jgi:hypothetical protein
VVVVPKFEIDNVVRSGMSPTLASPWPQNWNEQTVVLDTWYFPLPWYWNIEICSILGFYAAQNGSFLPTFRYKLSAPSSRVKQSKKTLEELGCPETSVRNCHSALRKIQKKKAQT